MSADTIKNRVEELFLSQVQNWDTACVNYSDIDKVKIKDFGFDDFTIKVQFNPARIRSSAAKVDAKSIQERKCFLCPDNLPPEQEGVPFGNDYQILVNPYPIFPKHFTIPAYKHTDQLIYDRYTDMLDLAKELSDYVVFYNGPKCGASAPDHVHFQAGIKGILPIEKDIASMNRELIYSNGGSHIYALKHYLRNGFLIVSDLKGQSVSHFNRVYSSLEIKDGDSEPMMNILLWVAGGRYYSCVFPREKHRPTCFYAEGDDKLLISPASVDLGGLFITPREEDFEKITTQDIVQILKEVCLDDEKMRVAINKMSSEDTLSIK